VLARAIHAAHDCQRPSSSIDPFDRDVAILNGNHHE
jgi:hypothetical protein